MGASVRTCLTVVAALFALTGCGGSDDEPESGVSGTAQATTFSPPPLPPALRQEHEHTEADPTPPPTSMLSTAARYLHERENRSSYGRTRGSWLADIRPFMTTESWRKLATRPDRGGIAAVTFQENRWAVTIEARCDYLRPPSTADSALLNCTLIDTTIDQSRSPVPDSALPAVWDYSGQQLDAVLLMRQVGGKWLVHEDFTGRSASIPEDPAQATRKPAPGAGE